MFCTAFLYAVLLFLILRQAKLGFGTKLFG